MARDHEGCLPCKPCSINAQTFFYGVVFFQRLRAHLLESCQLKVGQCCLIVSPIGLRQALVRCSIVWIQLHGALEFDYRLSMVACFFVYRPEFEMGDGKRRILLNSES